ncbi:Trans-2,3-dihydro-3-hydroxyanthranilate isomerase [Austwickia sp. TVS 96-490-7B]|uniref:PhzF family phenazine biosynthesis protein n=1 Tax=Austwickia sp. TVS 96-490-7B TaxID=2830843 RepID=UPI001C561F98|nr:PhzF family phenazine biosynthesis protein [Austwickia sp. TVS 96-490-7B]MBW3083964.1 Trans-2,3-dihydro-3-hydroxyanthranilate isomerase [Austwickia sp. TVS 96-490-7B]
MDLTFRLINVFAESHDPFSGNAIAVFENCRDLGEDAMQAISRQVNLETVFLLEVTEEGADIRFYSPEGKGRFAGSASLGTAHVVDELSGARRAPMRLTSGPESEPTWIKPYGRDNWQIRAREAESRKLKSSPQILASLVGLPTTAISDDVMLINSGRSGVVLPVKTVEDVAKTHLDARMLHSYAMLLNTDPQVYVWARRDEKTIVSRMFYGPGGGVLEVAATGSGAANLGHWLSAHGESGQWHIYQGAAVGRPSVLDLDVAEDQSVFVGGHVNQVASGVLSI